MLSVKRRKTISELISRLGSTHSIKDRIQLDSLRDKLTRAGNRQPKLLEYTIFPPRATRAE